MVVDEDYDLKICKKIAQLTRVIYQLNLKNEENDLIIQNCVRFYEKDIEQMYRECNNLVMKLQEDYRTFREQNDSRARVSEMREGFEWEKARLERQFSELKEQSGEQRVQFENSQQSQLLLKNQIEQNEQHYRKLDQITNDLIRKFQEQQEKFKYLDQENGSLRLKNQDYSREIDLLK